MIILQYHEIFFRLTATRCLGMAAGAVSLRKSHDIVILSFFNIVKGQAKRDSTGWTSIRAEDLVVCDGIILGYVSL